MNPKHELEKMLPKKKEACSRSTCFDSRMLCTKCGFFLKSASEWNDSIYASLDALCKRVVGVEEVKKLSWQLALMTKPKNIAQALNKEFVILRREK